MLKLLGKLLNRDLSIPQEPIDTNVSEDEIWEILHPSQKGELLKKKKALKSFLQAITTHLSKTESQRLCRVAANALNDSASSLDALSEVIWGEQGQKRNKWVFIQLDWKATEEISWQVTEILLARGVKELWVPNCAEIYGSAPEALIALSHWLASRGLTLMHLETDSDSYCAFVVINEDVVATQELAKQAGLNIYGEDTFIQNNA